MRRLLKIAVAASLIAWCRPGAAGSGDGPADPQPITEKAHGLSQPLVSLYDSRVLSQEDRYEVGSVEGDRFGEALAPGDFNRDGVTDLAVGSPGKSLSGGPAAGAVFPFRGSGGGPTEVWYLPLDEAGNGGVDQAGDQFGAAVVAGDFNGDGFADLAIGAPGKATGGLAGSGTVLIFYGSIEWPAPGGSLAETMAGQTAAAGDQFGAAVAAGDFNGDGYDDLAIGAPGKGVGGNGAAGMVFVFPGSPSGLSTGGTLTSSAVGHAPGANDGFGSSLVGGDFTADGRADLAVGLPGRTVTGAAGAGAVAVVRGSAAGLSGGLWVTEEDEFEISEAGDQFGFSLAVADLDGDGATDLVVGVPGEGFGSSTGSGMACTFYGGGPDLVQGECVSEASAGLSSETGARFGQALGGGDLDADGFSEVVVGAPGSALGGAAGAGALFFFAGTANGIASKGYLVQEDIGRASQSGDGLGSRVAVADLDGDGAADVAAGAHADTSLPGVHSGTVFMFPGLKSLSSVKYGPITGAVTDTSVRLWARADRPASLVFEYRVAGTSWPGTLSSPLALDTTGDLAGSITLTGLTAATSYEYRARLDGRILDQAQGSFRTLPPAGATVPVTFGIGADLHYGDDPFAIFDFVRTRAPSFMLLVGDQIYADAPDQIAATEWEFGRKYRENWTEPHFAAFAKAVPSFMIWDDHEIEDNWSSGMSGRYVPARAAYDIYQGSHNPAPRVAQELYYTFRAGQAGFYVMDTRSHRSAEGDPDGPTKTMLGSTQKQDLEAWLSSTTDRFKFLVSSVMWNDHGTTGPDSWTGYQTERQEIFNYIKAHHVCGVVLLSGDQHWTGVFNLAQASPYVLRELSPTPLGTSPRARTTDSTSDILFTYDASRVYGFVTVAPAFPQGRVMWDVFDNLDHAIHHLELDWPALCPDSDGDTRLDDVDCRPDDASVWSIPGEVVITWSSQTMLTWTPPSDPGGAATPVYDLLVSTSAGDFTSGAASCLASNAAALSATDTTVPATNHARYYLVRAENACGGTLGTTSSGATRAGRSCP